MELDKTHYEKASEDMRRTVLRRSLVLGCVTTFFRTHIYENDMTMMSSPDPDVILQMKIDRMKARNRDEVKKAIQLLP